MNISISNLNHRIIWNEVWDRLALPVQSELWEFLIDIKEIPLIDAPIDRHIYKFLYGRYQGKNIWVFEEDLKTLSDDAIHGVMAHELGHAYCDIKRELPGLCLDSIKENKCPMHDVLYSLETFNLDWCSAANEQSANLVAQAWGFKKELMALEHDRKLPEEI